ncbi:MAG: NTP transferase domain-containing protein [Sphingomonadaceae bacterium]
MADGQLTALVLAGRRDGVVDPLAETFGVEDKCLVPIAGQPLIAHVLLALASSPLVSRIIVSINNPDLLADVQIARELQSDGRLVPMVARHNLAESIFFAAESAEFPLLVTTADNVLFTHQAVSEMHSEACERNADAAVAFSRRDNILAAHPDGQRRFYAFADDAYSNCNCYWIKDARALSAAEVFRSGGQFAKHPMRIANAFGILNLIRFRLGLGSLAKAFERFSKRLGLALSPVIFADGALAIDVDNARTYKIAEELLVARLKGDGGQGSPASARSETGNPVSLLI